MLKNNINYEFYFNSFCGGVAGKIPAADFERCADIAVGEINRFLNYPVTDEWAEEYARCVCEVAEIMFRNEKSSDLKSETIDGYSVTFADRADSRKETDRVIIRRLGKTELLYAGVE